MAKTTFIPKAASPALFKWKKNGNYSKIDGSPGSKAKEQEPHPGWHCYHSANSRWSGSLCLHQHRKQHTSRDQIHNVGCGQCVLYLDPMRVQRSQREC